MAPRHTPSSPHRKLPDDDHMWDEDDEYDTEAGDRVQRPKVATTDVVSIFFVIVVILVLAIALPFVLVLDNNEDSQQESLSNVTRETMVPTTSSPVVTLLPTSSPTIAVSTEAPSSLAPTASPTAAPTVAPSSSSSTTTDTTIPRIVGGPFQRSQNNSFFGYSVTMDASLAIIGAPYDGDGRAGSITTVAIQPDSTWAPVTAATIMGSTPNELFGWSLQLPSSNRLIVGAPREVGEAGGSAMVYLYNADSQPPAWAMVGSPLRGTDANDERFATAVAMSAYDPSLSRPWVAAVGAPAHNQGSGGVYTFRYDESTADWVSMTTAPVVDDSMLAGGMLGSDVAISEDGSILVAGAPMWGQGFGKVSAYEWNGLASAWFKIWEAAGINSGGNFGSSVRFLDARTFAVGEPGAAAGSGVVSVYQRASETTNFEQLGPSIVGSAGQALGMKASISGTVGNNGQASIILGTADGLVQRYDYNGQTWTMPFTPLPVGGGEMTSVALGQSVSTFIVGTALANNAYIFGA